MEHVEGEWNGFIFSRATEANVDEIQEIMLNHYFPDEPMTKLMGYSKEYDEDFQRIWKFFIKDDLTFFARDIKTNKMAGLRVIFEHRKDIDWAQFNLVAPQTVKLLGCVEVLDAESNLMEKYGLDTYADLLITTVHRDFRGRGLATEMYRRAKALTRARGFYLAKACFSSVFSRAAATRVGFVQVASMEVAEAKGENGELLFENATDEKITQAIFILKE